MKYESPTSNGSKVMAKAIKVFRNKGHGQGHLVKNFEMNKKVSSKGMYMINMKALPQIVQKLRQSLKFLGI